MKLNKKLKILIIVVIFITCLSSLFLYLNNKKDYKKLSYNDFINYMEKRKIQRIELSSNSTIVGKLKNGEYFLTDNPRTENFKEKLLTNNVKVVETNGNSSIKNGLTFLIFFGVIGGLGYFLNKNIGKQAQKEIAIMSDVNSKSDNFSSITFKDVAGNEEAKESLKELVDFIKNPDKYSKYGVRMPRGVLLYGPPGTGKTLLARALAGEADVPFFAVTGSDFIQVYAGLGASRIRSLFKKAKQYNKSVIFIDEIDALGKKRKGSLSSGSSEEGDRTLNALLTEMSGFEENQGIIVIAATNRIDTLDEALLRPGRFDRQIEVGLPDVNARYKILKLHSENKPLKKDVDLKKVAYETVYFSGAKLENLMNESAMIAAKNDDSYIDMNHINSAFYTVLVGKEKKDRSSINMKDREITAYHEAGHALIAKKVSKFNRVTKVSIIPSTNGTGGFSMNIPPNRMYQSRKDIIDNVMISLGGRAAEDIIFGKEYITTGASNDLKKATEMILTMIGILGMDDELGLLNYEVMLGQNIGGNTYLLNRAKKLINSLYMQTKKILMNNNEYLKEIANTLLKQEVISEDELNSIVC